MSQKIVDYTRSLWEAQQRISKLRKPGDIPPIAGLLVLAQARATHQKNPHPSFSFHGISHGQTLRQPDRQTGFRNSAATPETPLRPAGLRCNRVLKQWHE